MMKRIAALLLVGVLCLGCLGVAEAHNKEKHWTDLRQVLFGPYHHLTNEDQKVAFDKLKYASALAIDQFNGHYDNFLQQLNNWGVHGIPNDLSAINFTCNSHHRSHTHRGWDFSYVGEKAHWSTRQDLLLATVENVFNFDMIGGTFVSDLLHIEYREKCVSMGAVIYYVHVLGDLIEAKTYKADDIIIPLARKTPYQDNPDIFFELNFHLPILFQDQVKTTDYCNMMRELEDLSIQARALAAMTGGVREEQFPEYHDYTVKCLNILKKYLPRLLKNEPFFTNVFPTP